MNALLRLRTAGPARTGGSPPRRRTARGQARRSGEGRPVVAPRRASRRDSPRRVRRAPQDDQEHREGGGPLAGRPAGAALGRPCSPNQIQISTARTTTIGSTTSSGSDQRSEQREHEGGQQPPPACPGDPPREHVDDEGRVRVRDRLLHEQVRVEHPGNRDRGDRRREGRAPPGERRASKYTGTIASGITSAPISLAASYETTGSWKSHAGEITAEYRNPETGPIEPDPAPAMDCAARACSVSSGKIHGVPWLHACQP